MYKYILKIKREFIALISRIFIDHISTNYNGLNIKVPLIHGMRNGGYIVPAEQWITDCLQAFTSTNKGMVLDIGANVGLILVKLKTISDDINYCGIEANPSCSFYTQELIRLNNFKNAKLFTVALSDGVESRRFYSSRAGDSTGSLIYEHQELNDMAYSFDVVTITGDQFVDTLEIDEDGISVIKIDVEGAEIYVLNGLEDTIDKYRPYVFSEILHTNNDEQKQRALDICTLLTSKDYSVIGINNSKNKLEVIDDINEVGTKKYEQEFVFSPKDKVDSFLNAMKNNKIGLLV